MIRGQVEETAKLHIPQESVEEQWDVPGLETALAAEYQIAAPVTEWVKNDHDLTDETIRERVAELATKAWADRRVKP